MRAIHAQIDCHSRSMHSPYLQKPVPLNFSPRGLFLVDLNQIVDAAKGLEPRKEFLPGPMTETFVSDQPAANECLPTVLESIDEIKATGVGEAESPMHFSHQPNEIAQMFQAVTGRQLQTNSNMSNAPEAPITRTSRSTAETEAQSSTTPLTLNPFSGTPHCHVAVESSPTDADVSAGRSRGDRRSQSAEPRGPGSGTDHLCAEAPRGDVSHSMTGSRVGVIHGRPLPEQCQASSSTFHPYRTAGGELRAGAESSDAHTTCNQPCTDTVRCSQSQGYAQASHSATADTPCAGGDASRDRGRRGMVSDPSISHGPRLGPRHAAATPQHGRRDDACHAPPGEPECRAECQVPDPARVSEDTDESACTMINMEVKGLQQMIIQFESELQEVISSTQPLGSRWTLGEVFCSQQSPLTQQVQEMGKSAFRFGYGQGDLATSKGRNQLFQMIARHRPRHLWFSPVCGPWSSWSQLNASRSLEQ